MLTGKDGLVDTQGGGPDGNKPDVSRNFVTNCGKQRVFLINTHCLLCMTVFCIELSKQIHLTSVLVALLNE